MAKGQKSKEIVMKKLLDIFEGSFQYDKEIRVPMMEDGEPIQLKVTLTCAKTNVEPNGDVAIPGETISNEINFTQSSETVTAEVSEEEKNNIARLAKMLNL